MRRFSIIAVLAALLSACAAPGTAVTTTTPDGTTTTTPDATTTTPPGVTTTGAPGEGVHLADTGLGQILVDGNGMTLYVFGADTDGESTCSGSCATTWPAVPGDAQVGSGLDSALFEFGTVERTDGTTQLTVNSQPLYYYSGDAAPGDTRGQLLSNIWFVIAADGTPIDEEGPQGGASGTTVPDDYDY